MSATPSPSLFFLSASPCLEGLGLALGKNKEGEGVAQCQSCCILNCRMRHSNGVFIDVVLHSVGGSWEAVRSSVWHWGSSFHCVVVVSADNEMVVGRRPLFKTQSLSLIIMSTWSCLGGGSRWVDGWEGEGG